MKDRPQEPTGSATLKVAGEVVKVAADALSTDQSGVGIEVASGGGQITVSLSIGADRRTSEQRRRLMRRFFSFQTLVMLIVGLIAPIGRGAIAMPAVVRFIGLGFFIFIGYFFGIVPLYQGACWVGPKMKLGLIAAAQGGGSASLWTLKTVGIVLLWLTLVYPLYKAASVLKSRVRGPSSLPDGSLS